MVKIVRVIKGYEVMTDKGLLPLNAYNYDEIMEILKEQDAEVEFAGKVIEFFENKFGEI